MPHRNTLFSLVLLALPACVDEADDTTPDPASTAHPSSGAGPDAPSTAASTDELDEQPTTTQSSDPVDPTDVDLTTGAPDTTTGTPEPTSTGTTGDGTTTTGETTTTTEPPSADESTTTVGEDACACPDIAVSLDDGIFVITDNSELWKYRPALNTYEMLGAIDCGLAPSVHSMAVDRGGAAWIMYRQPAGALRKVDVAAPQNCVDPGYAPQQMGVDYFGMAFVSNSADDACDRLYGNAKYGGLVDEGEGLGDLLSVDPQSLQLSLIAPTDFNGGELTGTGDGRLFLFAGSEPAKLTEYDKATGAVLGTLPLPGLEKTYSFAVAFYAGDFFFFTESGGYKTPSKVTRLDFDDSDDNGVQDLVTVHPQGPIRIVGAGVSTCAPYVPM